jgi:hypothetical protein
VLPASISKRNKDATRFFMFATLYSKLIIAVNLARWFELRQTTRSLLFGSQTSCPSVLLSIFGLHDPICEISRAVREELRSL